MSSANNKKMPFQKISIKNIHVFLLGLVLVSLLAITLVPLYRIKISHYSTLESGTEEIFAHVVNEGSKLFEKSQSEVILQKSRDVASQLSLFFKYNKQDYNLLKQDTEFINLAVQPIGDKGYTALYECGTLITKFHKNKELNNKDISHLKNVFPDWWKIYDRRNDCAEASGFYDWKDSDGSIRKKFMAVSPIKGTNYMLAATTYLDEFDKDKNIINNFSKIKIKEMREVLSLGIDSLIKNVIIIVIGVVLIFYLLTVILIRKFVKFIYGIKSFSTNIGNANYHVQLLKDSQIIEFNDIHEGLNFMKAKILEYQRELIDKTKQLVMVNTARQVAHDIRSPLAALSAATEFVKKLPEVERTLIRSAIQRIDDIANDLSGKKVKNSGESKVEPEQQKLSVELLPSLIDFLVSEKRVQYRSRLGLNIESQLDSSSYGLFAKIQLVQLKRVLSNLVNNAVEAMGEKGKVFVSLKTCDNIIQITVSDNGKGIPENILPKLMQEGSTFGKEKDKQSGSGLGLYHARESVKSWGGEIEIKSEMGQGTDVIITLPRAESPDWFVSKIEISEATKIVILDDDDSIHQVWKNRFSEIKFKKENVFHFGTAEDVRKNFSSAHMSEREFLFLFDYELLGSKLTGLDLIEELNVAQNAILVTSHFEENDVRARSEKLGVRLLPKNLAGFVPIVLSPLTPAPRTLSLEGRGESDVGFVLIDDENMNHVAWKTLAAMKKKKLSTFYSPAEFFKQMGKFDKSTNIYIDSNLENNLKGELVAKMIYKKGFEKIYLCTGHSPQDFPQDMPWITGIVGKMPPFGEE